jgi:isochorismate synthase
MTNDANCLLEQHHDEIAFFYASPVGSLRVDGQLSATSDVEEAPQLLDFYAQKNPKETLIVGALPFHRHRPVRLIIPKRVVYAGAPSPKPLPIIPLAIRAQKLAYSPTPEQFMTNVSRALERLHSKSLAKVVLSRMINITTDDAINIKNLLCNLLRTNRLGRTFYLSNPSDSNHSVLVGSSPEVIMAKKGRTIRTNPLAGSSARSPDPAEDYCRGNALLHSEKELHEHALMIGAIETILRPFCSSLHVPKQPSLISTPTMWHLSSQIRGSLHDPNIDSLTLARALHPTPAVCGHPTEIALQSIHDLEGYDREWYAGLIGWMNHQGDGEWALTIRCAQIIDRTLTLYAGAGIVEGSEPNKELAETQAKFHTLSNALGIELQ